MIKNNVDITIQPGKIARLLNAIVILLVIGGITSFLIKIKIGYPTALGFVPKFALDQENNLPTYFSSVLLLVASLLLAVIAVLKKQQRDTYASKWKLLAYIFLFLSLDEAASIHEFVSLNMNRIFSTSGLFHYAWVIPGTVFVGISGYFFRGFLLDLPLKIRRRFTVAAVVYIGGALGVELLEGYYAELHGEGLTFHLLVTIEEAFEMIGVVLFINALLDYLSSIRSIKFRVEGKS